MLARTRDGWRSWIEPGARGELSRPGESEADFRVRLAQLGARGARRRGGERARRSSRAEGRGARGAARRAEGRRRREAAGEAGSASSRPPSLGGATVFGALFGRRSCRRRLGRASTTARALVGRASKEGGDVERAEESRRPLCARSARRSKPRSREPWRRSRIAADGAGRRELETVIVKPKKGDVEVVRVALAGSEPGVPGRPER